MKTFEWFPSVCAPAKQPMRIVEAIFLLSDETAMRIPDGKILHQGWGQQGTIFLLGNNASIPLPIALKILIFSFIENVFYQGNVDLPWDTISYNMENGFIHPHSYKKTTFSCFLIGIAPGGYIQIWLTGNGVAKEVFSHYLMPADFDWDKFVVDSQISRENYIRETLKEKFGQEHTQMLLANKDSKNYWENLNRKYNYTLNVISQHEILESWLIYINGEREFIHWENHFRMLNKRPVSEKLKVLFQDQQKKSHLLNLTLDSKEFRHKINYFADNHKDIYMELVLFIPLIDKNPKIFLSTKSNYIELKEVTFQFFTLSS